MSFAYDSACLYEPPAHFFYSGSDYYTIVILEGYVYSSVQVVNPIDGYTIGTTITNNSRPMTTSVRLPSSFARPGKSLIFVTPEKIMPRVFTAPDKFTLPRWSGFIEGGLSTWRWTVPN